MVLQRALVLLRRFRYHRTTTSPSAELLAATTAISVQALTTYVFIIERLSPSEVATLFKLGTTIINK
jgi:hypothetical protein